MKDEGKPGNAATQPHLLPRPKKHFGQHFLVSQHHLERIAGSIPARSTDHVLEIGPGRGALTRHLVKRFPLLHCIERDRELIPVLEEALCATECTIHCGDALDFDFALAGIPLHVAGNLPYSVGALIIKKTLLEAPHIASCTFMVQREVAERICALPDTKANGFLSIFCQFFGAPKILFNVPPGAFTPRPDVDSSVFQLIPDPVRFNRIPRSGWERFFKFVDAGFSQRRKKLSALLSRSIPGHDFASAFSSLSLGAGARAEDLDADAWARLYLATIGS